MPVSAVVRGSTQDSSTGVPVAAGVNEVTSGNILQTTIQEGNKTTYAATARTGLTAADANTDMSTTSFASAALIDVGNAMCCVIDGKSSVASATISGRLILYDGSSNCIGMSELVAFQADATRRITAAGDYVSSIAIADVGRARYVKFFVEAVSAGTWAITTTPC